MEERYELRFAVDPGFMEMVERIKSILSTREPRGLDFESLFRAVMRDYLDRHGAEGRTKRRGKRAQRARQERKKEHDSAQPQE